MTSVLEIQVDVKDLYETKDTNFLLYVQAVCERVYELREANK